jgi:hypothetical protein
MNFSKFFNMLLPAAFAVLLVAFPSITDAEIKHRTIVVRERNSAELLDGAFVFKVLKLRGYTIEVKFLGQKQSLKIGESLSSPNGDCNVTFDEIATETRLARFSTDCP